MSLETYKPGSYPDLPPPAGTVGVYGWLKNNLFSSVSNSLLTILSVILPQARRVIIPPLTSQYLNLTKNSSLAIAIGYMDLVATLGGISLNQTGREMETMVIVMLIYLSVSLSISAFMNWYNSRVKLVGR